MTTQAQVTPATGASNLDVSSAADLIGDMLGGDPGAFDRDNDGANTPDQDPEPTRKDEEPVEEDSGTDDDAAAVAESDDPEGDNQEPEESYELEELAEAMGMTAAELLARVKHKAKVDGAELEVTLEEALKGYQREEDYSKKTMELAGMRKRVEEANLVADQYVQQMQSVAAQHGALLQQMESTLLASYQNEDWATLRQNDPAEYAARESEYQKSYQHIQMQKQGAVHQLQMAEAQKAAYLEQVLAPHEQQLLRDSIPEWSDSTVAEKERQEVARYLIDQGYRPEEVGQLYDHRSAVIARKAWLWDTQKAKASKGEKLAKKLPAIKNLKPGSRKSASAARKSQRVESLKRLRKTGSISDAVAALPDFD